MNLGHLKAYSGMVHGDRKGNKQGGRPSLLARHMLGFCALLLSFVLQSGQLIGSNASAAVSARLGGRNVGENLAQHTKSTVPPVLFLSNEIQMLCFFCFCFHF